MRKFGRLIVAPLVSLVALVTMPLFVAPAAAGGNSCNKVGANIVCTGDINVTIEDVVGNVTVELLDKLEVTIGDVLSNNEVCKADRGSQACSDIVIEAVKTVLVLHKITWKKICVGLYCKA